MGCSTGTGMPAQRRLEAMLNSDRTGCSTRPDSMHNGGRCIQLLPGYAYIIADEQSEIECVDTKKSTTPNFFEMVLFTWYQNDTLTAKPPLKK